MILLNNRQFLCKIAKGKISYTNLIKVKRAKDLQISSRLKLRDTILKGYSKPCLKLVRVSMEGTLNGLLEEVAKETYPGGKI